MNDDTSHHKSSFFSDFYVDFFGSLIPGLFAVVLGATVLISSGNVLCFAVCQHVANQSQPFPSLGTEITQWKDIGLGPYGNLGLLLVVAYVLGSIFYRQDPKIPDFRSARRIWRELANSKQEQERQAVQPTGKSSPDIMERDITEFDAQFPYFYLYEYLDGRGLVHLTKWVPWKGRDEKTWPLRTKMFVNVLKIRLQYLMPEKCKDIVRNEAHVRMATSIWFAARWLIFTTLVSSLIASTAGILLVQQPPNQTLLNIIFFDIVVGCVAFFIKYKVEKFIHYLRVREVVYVLEMADFAERNKLSLHREDFSPARETIANE